MGEFAETDNDLVGKNGIIAGWGAMAAGKSEVCFSQIDDNLATVKFLQSGRPSRQIIISLFSHYNRTGGLILLSPSLSISLN